MDEDVIKDLYARAQGLGYGKSIEEFTALLHTDDEVLQDNFSYVQEQGYPKGLEDFSVLVGRKKKEPSESVDIQQPTSVAEEVGISASVDDPGERLRGLRMGVSRLNEDGSRSTVKMADMEVDGKFVAIPTLYPKDPNNFGPDAEDWIEFGEDDAMGAYDMALQRGEVFEFDTPEEASQFAQGSWKSLEEEAPKDAFERKLDFVDSRLIDRLEAGQTARELEYEFGDYGFTFDRGFSVGIGNYITVTANNGETIDINTNPQFLTDEDEQTQLLKDFLIKNRGTTEKLKLQESIGARGKEMEEANTAHERAQAAYNAAAAQLERYAEEVELDPERYSEAEHRRLVERVNEAAQADEEAVNEYNALLAMQQADMDAYEAATREKGEELTALERAFGKNAVTDFIADNTYRAVMQGQAQAGTIRSSYNLTVNANDVTDEDIQDFLRAQAVLEQNGPSDEMRDFQRRYKDEGGGWGGFVKALFSTDAPPLMELFVSSVSMMVNKEVLAGAAAGAAGGAAVGATGFSLGPLGAFTTAGGAISGAMGGAGASLEAGISFAEFLREEMAEKQGVDPDKVVMNNEKIREVLSDEEAMARIRRRQAGRGIAIGVTSMIGTAVAANVTRRVAVKTGKKLKAAATGALAEMPFEGLGEASGRLVAAQEMDAAEIGLEALAGGPAQVAGVAMGLFKAPQYTLNGELVTGEQMAAFIRDADEADVAGATIEIKNDDVLAKEAHTKRDDARERVVIKEQLRKSGVENDEQVDRLADLELEKRKLKGLETTAANRKRERIQNEIDAILDGDSYFFKETVDEEGNKVSKEVRITRRDALLALAEDDILNPTEKEIEAKRAELFRDALADIQETDAVQEREAAPVDVGEQARDGEEVGEGVEEEAVVDEEAEELAAAFEAESTPDVEEDIDGVRVRRREGYQFDRKAQRILDQAKKRVKSLSNFGVNIVLHENDAQYEAATGKRGRGVYDNKTIHINLARANSRTVAHEAFHALFLERVKGDDAKAQQWAKATMKSVRKALDADSVLATRIDDFLTRYEEDIIDEEALAEIFGYLSEGYGELTAPQQSSVKAAIRKLFELFGVKLEAQWSQDDQNVIDVFNMLAGKMERGEEITEAELAGIDVSEEKAEEARAETEVDTRIAELQKKRAKAQQDAATETRLAELDDAIGRTGDSAAQRVYNKLFKSVGTGQLRAIEKQMRDTKKSKKMSEADKAERLDKLEEKYNKELEKLAANRAKAAERVEQELKRLEPEVEKATKRERLAQIKEEQKEISAKLAKDKREAKRTFEGEELKEYVKGLTDEAEAKRAALRDEIAELRGEKKKVSPGGKTEVAPVVEETPTVGTIRTKVGVEAFGKLEDAVREYLEYRASFADPDDMTRGQKASLTRRMNKAGSLSEKLGLTDAERAVVLNSVREKIEAEKRAAEAKETEAAERKGAAERAKGAATLRSLEQQLTQAKRELKALEDRGATDSMKAPVKGAIANLEAEIAQLTEKAPTKKKPKKESDPTVDKTTGRKLTDREIEHDAIFSEALARIKRLEDVPYKDRDSRLVAQLNYLLYLQEVTSNLNLLISIAESAGDKFLAQDLRQVRANAGRAIIQFLDKTENMDSAAIDDMTARLDVNIERFKQALKTENPINAFEKTYVEPLGKSGIVLLPSFSTAEASPVLKEYVESLPYTWRDTPERRAAAEGISVEELTKREAEEELQRKDTLSREAKRELDGLKGKTDKASKAKRAELKEFMSNLGTMSVNEALAKRQPKAREQRASEVLGRYKFRPDGSLIGDSRLASELRGYMRKFGFGVEQFGDRDNRFYIVDERGRRVKPADVIASDEAFIAEQEAIEAEQREAQAAESLARAEAEERSQQELQQYQDEYQDFPEAMVAAPSRLSPREQRESLQDAAAGFDDASLVKFAKERGYSDKAILAIRPGATDAIAAYDAQATRLSREVQGVIERTRARARGDKKIQAIENKGLRTKAINDRIIKDVKAYIRKSKMYEEASDVGREAMLRAVDKQMGRRVKAAPSVLKILDLTPDKGVLIDKKNLIEQIRAMARSSKATAAASREIMREVGKDIAKLKATGAITGAQATAILRKLTAMDPFNPVQVENFVNYAARVFAEAEHAQEVNRLNKLRKRAYKNAGKKLGIAQDLMPMLQTLLNIDAGLIPESVFEQYQKLVNDLGERKAVLDLDERAKVSEDVVNIMAGVSEELAKKEELFARYDSFRKKGDSVSATIDAMVEQELLSEDEVEVLKKYANELREKETMTEEEKEAAREEERVKLMTAIGNLPKLKRAFPTQKENQLVDRFNKLMRTQGVDGLSNADLKNVLRVADNIQNGFLPHTAQVLVEQVEVNNRAVIVEQAVKEAKLPRIARVRALFDGITNDTAIARVVERNPLRFIDQVYGDYKSSRIYDAVFKDLASGYASYKADIMGVQQRLDKVEQKLINSLNRNPNRITRSKFLIGAYMMQAEFDANPTVPGVFDAVSLLDATIEKSNKSKGRAYYSAATADMLSDIRKKIDGKSAEEIREMLSEEERAVADEIRAVNDSLTPKAEYVAGVLRGVPFRPFSQYFHRIVLKADDKQGLKGVDALIDQAKTRMRRPSTKAQNVQARQTTSPPAVNFDPFASAKRGARYILTDYHMTEAVRTNARLLNKLSDADFTRKQRKFLNAIDDASETAVTDALVQSYTISTVMEKVFETIKRQGYRVVLADLPRMAAELKSNILMVMTAFQRQFLTGVGKYYKTMATNGGDVLKNVGSVQTTRLYADSGTISSRMVETIRSASGPERNDAANAVSNRMKQIWAYTGASWGGAVGQLADTMITTPDKLATRPVWFGTFALEFKEQTGQEVDFDKIAANDEAYMAEHAEAIKAATDAADLASVQVGATDNPFLGIVNSMRKPDAKNLYRVVNSYMTRFLVFEFVSARTAVNAMVGNGMISPTQGFKLMLGVTGRMISYVFLANILRDAVDKALEIDDEDDETVGEKLEDAALSSMLSLVLGGTFGAIPRGLAATGVEYYNRMLMEDAGLDYEYEDQILIPLMNPTTEGQAYKKEVNALIRASGPYNPILRTSELGARIFLEEPKKSREAIKRRDAELYRLGLEVLGLMGMVPLYKDIRRVMVKQIYKDIDKEDTPESMGEKIRQRTEEMKKKRKRPK